MKFFAFISIFVLLSTFAECGRIKRQRFGFGGPVFGGNQPQPEVLPQPQPQPVFVFPDQDNFLQYNTHPGFAVKPTQPPTITTTLSPQIQKCIESCIDTTPGNYNPVCGSDNVSYQNRERFDCANDCGANLKLVRNGACKTSRATTPRPAK